MAHGMPYPMLIDLAQRELDAAASAMGELQRRRDALAQQGEGLDAFRGEYRTRLSGATGQGITMGEWRNFEAFLGSLDTAMTRQGAQLAALDAQIAQALAVWRDKKRKLNSFQALAERAERQAEARRARVLQREIDEFAARRALSRARDGA